LEPVYCSLAQKEEQRVSTLLTLIWLLDQQQLEPLLNPEIIERIKKTKTHFSLLHPIIILQAIAEPLIELYP
jgi:hypothetical protein